MTTLLHAVRTADPAEQRRTVRVALAGCGTVGGQLLALLREHGAAIADHRGIRVEITRVLVRDTLRPRAIPLPPGIVTDDVDSFLHSPADIVVEAMGGVELPDRIATATLAAGRHFVTANKALIAARGVALRSIADRTSTRLAFEAAVAGGVPIIRVVRDALLRDDVRRISGILNGTTNFILTAMERGAAFAESLAEAQARGFAEADPSRDLDGQDAADKITILAWLASGASPAALPVQRTGLLPDPDALTAAASAMNGAVRLLAEYVRLPDGVALSVEPVLVARDSAFARTAAQDNHVVVETGWNGSIALSGPGAGGAPTASALLSDVLDGALPASRFDGRESTSRIPDGIADPRLHGWVLCVRAPTARALDVIAAAGVEVEGVVQNRVNAGLVVVTRPCTRAVIDSVLNRLAGAGVPAVRLRNALVAEQ